MPVLPPPPRDWDLTSCHESSKRLQVITAATKPLTVFHGHLHVSRHDMLKSAWGDVEVYGLDYDGSDENWRVIDCRSVNPAFS
jgi:hypothetical protein